MPNDFTPLRGRQIDARVRVAWLLRINRLAVAPGPAAAFVEKLRAHGCVLGPSTLCRYETGTEPVPASVVRAYELALNLPAGRLVGACAGLDRMFGSAFAPETGPVQMARAELINAMAKWEQGVAEGSMSGSDWVRAADVLSQPTGPVLPPSVLRHWVSQLVTETMRSVREAYTTRAHALGLLLADPGLSPLVLEAIDETTGEPGAQSVMNVLAILGSSPEPAVLRWLVTHFEQHEGEHQWGAAYGLLSQICRGTLPVELVPDVSRAVLDAAAEGLVRGRSAFMVAQRLSADLTRQVVSRLGCYPAPTASGARVQSPAGLNLYRAAALQESGLDDPMLDRLLREALSPDFVERRHHSLLLLAASPYRNVLANVAVGLLDGASEPYAADAASHAIVYLAGDGQRRHLVDLTTRTPRRRADLLAALTHSGGVPSSVDMVALADDPEQARAVVRAAGMSAHPSLRTFATSPDLLEPSLQRSAQWWRRTGPAITDSRQEVSDDILHLAG